MGRAPLLQPGVQDGQSHSRQKERRKNIALLTSCAFLRSDAGERRHNTDVDKLVEGRGDARFVLAVRARCRR